MAGRPRNTKKLAQRINREYFKRTFAITRWRRGLSLACVALGLGWLGWHAAARSQSVYSSGPLTPSHALLQNHCSACHAPSGAFATRVTDEACSSCHNGPPHQAGQTFTPACADCHREHQTAARLKLAGDQACTGCHADLKTREGPVRVAAHIRSFENGHPEFGALQSDPGTVRFNHAVHLKKELRGPRGTLQLQCGDCHRRQKGGRGSMQPVNYDEHCAACHPLRFEAAVSVPAPHRDPEVVRSAIARLLRDYIAAHPEELRAGAGVPRIPNQSITGPPRTASEWVDVHQAAAERLLWTQTCRECHAISPPPPAQLPRIAEAGIRTRWLPRSNFDHAAHQMLVCTACHANAPRSTLTSDVLLPGIQTCLTCHSQSGCNECHQYHDWTLDKHLEGRFTLGSFR